MSRCPSQSRCDIRLRIRPRMPPLTRPSVDHLSLALRGAGRFAEMIDSLPLNRYDLGFAEAKNLDGWRNPRAAVISIASMGAAEVGGMWWTHLLFNTIPPILWSTLGMECGNDLLFASLCEQQGFHAEIKQVHVLSSSSGDSRATSHCWPRQRSVQHSQHIL